MSNKIIKVILSGILGGITIRNHNRLTNIEHNIKNGIITEIRDEIMSKIQIDELRVNVKEIVDRELRDILSDTKKYAERNIDKTIKSINEQNTLKLSSDVNERLNVMDSKIDTLNRTSYVVVDNKYDLIRETINSGNYTSYEIERIIKSLEKL